MPAPIKSATIGGETYTVGQRVCISGRGTAALLHKHGAVERFTTTLMVVRCQGETKGTRRYRIGGDGLETGAAGGYGGSYVAPRCQRAKKQG
jgi:hypothetical protein